MPTAGSQHAALRPVHIFAGMSSLRIPKAISWMIVVGLIFLAIMTAFRMILVWRFPIEHGKEHHLPAAFFMGLRFDARMTGILCLLLLLPSFFKPVHPFATSAGKKISFGIIAIGLAILLVFYIADFGNFAYLHQRMRASLLNYVEDTALSMRMLWQTYPAVRIALAMIGMFIICFALFRYAYRKINYSKSSATRASRTWWNIAIFLLLSLAIFGKLGQYPLRWSDAYTLGNDYAANIALNPIQSFFSSLKFRHASYNEQKVREHYSWMAHFLNVNDPDSIHLNFTRNYHAVSGAKPFNVVFIICESFSAYKSSTWGNPLQTTPFFDSLCNKGVFFDHCFTPSFGTARGVWASITGIPDVMLSKTASRNPSIVDQHSIINDFKEHEKFYFLGGSTSWANIRGLLTNNINNLHLFEQDDFDAPKIDVWGISDKNLLLEANKKLAQQQKPFFAVIQTADNHRPYTIPEEDAKGFKQKTIPTDSLHKYGFETLEEYNAFRYTDFCFRSFFNAAKKEKYFGNTLFVMVGDHGIRGDAGNMFPAAWNNQGLTAEHVPLLFYYPSKLPAVRYNFPVSQVDILPTIASLGGVAYSNASLGRSVLLNNGLPDSSLQKAVFIFDPDIPKAGIITDESYFGYQPGNPGAYEWVSVKDNMAVRKNDSLVRVYTDMVEAMYETSRHMLYHNQKQSK